jgi:hypothetical protein
MSSSSDLNLLDNLEETLLDQLKDIYSREKRISDDLLESFYFLYKNQFLEALYIIDKYDDLEQQTLATTKKSPVTEYTAMQTGRKGLYQVVASSSSSSTSSSTAFVYLFDTSIVHFCPCAYFKFCNLTSTASRLMYCKHMILIKLCLAMNRVNMITINDHDFNDLLKLIQ